MPGHTILMLKRSGHLRLQMARLQHAQEDRIND